MEWKKTTSFGFDVLIKISVADTLLQNDVICTIYVKTEKKRRFRKSTIVQYKNVFKRKMDIKDVNEWKESDGSDYKRYHFNTTCICHCLRLGFFLASISLKKRC